MNFNSKILTSVIFFSLTILCCKKEPTIQPQSDNTSDIDSDFVFYPTKNAIWIIKSQMYDSIGIRYFIDTFYLGKDTTMLSRISSNGLNNFTDSASMKNYNEILVTGMTINSTLDTSYIPVHRVGWFRQDILKKRIYTPEFFQSDNIIYDRLEYDFSFDVGDTINFPGNWNYPLVVKSASNVNFCVRFLKRISYGPPSSTQPTGERTQALDFAAYNLTNYGLGHPGAPIWKRLIYKSDTLLVTY